MFINQADYQNITFNGKTNVNKPFIDSTARQLIETTLVLYPEKARKKFKIPAAINRDQALYQVGAALAGILGRNPGNTSWRKLDKLLFDRYIKIKQLGPIYKLLPITRKRRAVITHILGQIKLPADISLKNFVNEFIVRAKWSDILITLVK